MIEHRAYFCSCFCVHDSSVYVFGGRDQFSDTASCEKFILSQNTWVKISDMNSVKNSSSCVNFDKVLFVFGGNIMNLGNLDTIERYVTEFDIWTTISLKLRSKIHNTLAFDVGGSRVLIMGGTYDGPNGQSIAHRN